MKVLKILGWVVVAIIAFVALSVYLTAHNLNSIVKQVVEQVGSETLQTPVTLRDVDIQLMDGRAQLSGLTVSNLPGFDAPNLFQFDKVAVGINLEAMLDKTVDLTEVTIDGIKVVAEQKGTTTNIQQLVNNLPKSDSPKKQQPEEGADGEPLDILVKIRQFRFADSSATLVTEKWGEQTLNLPSISLQHLGGDQGVPPDQLAQAILRPLLKQINTAVEKGIRQAVEDKAREKLGEKEDELKEKYRSKLDEKLGDKADDVDSALKSMLKR